jgi:hypothetical protein
VILSPAIEKRMGQENFATENFLYRNGGGWCLTTAGHDRVASWHRKNGSDSLNR